VLWIMVDSFWFLAYVFFVWVGVETLGLSVQGVGFRKARDLAEDRGEQLHHLLL